MSENLDILNVSLVYYKILSFHYGKLLKILKNSQTLYHVITNPLYF